MTGAFPIRKMAQNQTDFINRLSRQKELLVTKDGREIKTAREWTEVFGFFNNLHFWDTVILRCFARAVSPGVN